MGGIGRRLMAGPGRKLMGYAIQDVGCKKKKMKVYYENDGAGPQVRHPAEVTLGTVPPGVTIWTKRRT
jgi:hypothetical protein